MPNDKLLEQLKVIRRTLHAHPEVSECEFETQQRILDYLSKTQLRVQKSGLPVLLLNLKELMKD